VRTSSLIILTATALFTACTPRAQERAGGAEHRETAGATAPAGDATSAGFADSAGMERLAAQVVQRGLRIHRGDVVMISGGAHTIPAMEALAIAATRAGGLQSILLGSERVLRAELRDIPEENLRQPLRYFADWLRSTTVYIGLPGTADPKAAFADIPEKRLAIFNERAGSIYDMLNGSDLRGTYIDYPSPGAAAAAGMQPEEFTRMQLAAIGTDPEAMARAGRALEAKVRRAKAVHITSPGGTDLTVTLAGRPGIVDAGMLAPGAEREKLFAKRWFILPGGSFGVAPEESSASGVIVTPRDQCKFKPVREARYEFSGGSLKSVTAREGEACIKEQLDPYGAGIRRIGSIGIGLNPELKVVEEQGDYRPWNAAGLVSVFLGDNTLMGGTNKVAGAVGIGLPIPHATLEVDGQVLVRDGKLAAEVVAAQR
jgi:leucyl aminopeptidase (aminopeptidase T)